MGKISLFSSRTQKEVEKRKTDEHHKQQTATSSNTEHQQTATTQQEASLRTESISNLQNAPVIEVYAEEVQRWCKVVYGNKNILQAKTKDILKNPAEKEPLLKQIKENPTSIHSLAGKNVFGFKTKARKNAEDAIPHLCSAIHVYAEAVKYKQENMDITVPVDSAEEGKKLQKSPDIKKGRDSLSNEQTTTQDQSSSSVGKCYAQIEHLSNIVYGDPHALQPQMEEILKDPLNGGKLAWAIAVNPKSFRKMSGYSVCGFKSDERVRAENHLLALYDAVMDYTSAVREAKGPSAQEQERRKNAEDLAAQKQAIIKNIQKIRERRLVSRQSTHPERSETTPVSAKVSSIKKPLSSEEIIKAVEKAPNVRRHYENVKQWCRVAYGDASVLQQPMDDIVKNPSLGEQIAQDLSKNPSCFHKLAGHSLGKFKNNTRKCAEDSLSFLCGSFKNYVCAVKEAKDAILKEHEYQQRFTVSASQLQEAKQKLQKSEERQHTQQRDMSQHRAKSTKGMAFAL